MGIAFLVSSLGDTDLAKATIASLMKQNTKDKLFIIPLTTVAATRTDDMIGNPLISRMTLEQITQQQGTLNQNKITATELASILDFMRDNTIQRAYIGVPSSDNDIPFQIASHLSIPFTIAYEYLFKPEKHIFWDYANALAANKNCEFAVPLIAAKNQLLEINENAQVYEIGHLSIDRSQSMCPADPTPARQSLSIDPEDQYIFISGTTQPTAVDNQFLEALLGEISTGQYPHLQLRMGLHPGIKDFDSYLSTLWETYEKYPKTKNQFKMILTTQIETKLSQPIGQNGFILRDNISGSEAAAAADKIAQAVPGALLNEAALKGKPAYFHEKTAHPYLPKKWFSDSIVTFFKATATPAHSLQELALQDTAPNLLALRMTKS